MARRLFIAPNGWPCTLKDCAPGHFVWHDNLCFKTEYRANATQEAPIGIIEAYNEAGEFFAGGVSTEAERENLIVQPVVAEWISDDE